MLSAGSSFASPATSPELVPFTGTRYITATWGAVSGGYHATPAIDIAMAVGSPVYAAGSGSVVRANVDARNCNPDTYPGGVDGCINAGYYGTSVTIQHPDGRFSHYAHLSAIQAGVWDHLRQYPADGTFIAGRTPGHPDNGSVYIVAGGAPIYLSSYDHVGGDPGTTGVDLSAALSAGRAESGTTCATDRSTARFSMPMARSTVSWPVHHIRTRRPTTEFGSIRLPSPTLAEPECGATWVRYRSPTLRRPRRQSRMGLSYRAKSSRSDSARPSPPRSHVVGTSRRGQRVRRRHPPNCPKVPTPSPFAQSTPRGTSTPPQPRQPSG